MKTWARTTMVNANLGKPASKSASWTMAQVWFFEVCFLTSGVIWRPYSVFFFWPLGWPSGGCQQRPPVPVKEPVMSGPRARPHITRRQHEASRHRPLVVDQAHLPRWTQKQEHPQRKWLQEEGVLLWASRRLGGSHLATRGSTPDSLARESRSSRSGNTNPI